MRLPRSLALIPALLFVADPLFADQNPLQVSEQSFSFEISDPAEPVNHTFDFFNSGSETIQVARIAVTDPLSVVKVLSKIPPGQGGQLMVSLGTPRQLGEYQGAIEITFKNKDLAPLRLPFTGKITPVIEVRPLPAFFVSTGRGQTKEASLQLINHDKEPLEITGIECASTRFSLRLETNHLGEDYTLFLKLSGAGKPGRSVDRIALRTTNRKQPVLLIRANTFIHDRVHTFPEELDFGTMELAQVKTNTTLRETLRQVLMVYQDGGTNFQVIAYSDLPFLKVSSQPAGKQVQVELELKPEELRPGDFQGHLELATSDPDFPKMEINVKGQVR